MAEQDNNINMEEEKIVNSTTTNDTQTEDVHEESKTSPEEENEKEEHKKSSWKKNKKNPLEERVAELEGMVAQKEDQYLRLHAEFDNYRKRTLKEKMELTKTAGESILVNILPVADDFERALQSLETSKEPEAIKEGVTLIYRRFCEFLKQNGIKEIDAKEQVFDTDLHEALTKIPAPTEELKGKVVDVIQKGYWLNDKVIRFSKVVIGE